METIQIRDFSAGWCPSDDQDNARPGALLNMDGVELDQNGALVLTSGSLNWAIPFNNFSYTAEAHTLFSAFLQGNGVHYISCRNGQTFRNQDTILSSGSIKRTAFLAAFDYVFIFSDTQRWRDNGASIIPIGITTPSAPTLNSGNPGNVSGTYEYALMFVYDSGAGYVAKSPLSPTTSITVTDKQVLISIPAFPVPTNTCWIFRRGENLDTFYRVGTTTTPSAQFVDNNIDQDLLDEGVITNEFLQSTNSVGLPDTIIGIAGLISQRAVLFSSSKIYFTELNSIDSYDTRTTINLGGSFGAGSEVFMWAHKIADNLIVVGTSKAIYALNGTLISQPDGTLDVALRTIDAQHPPIANCVDTWSNQLVYMAADGWRMFDLGGSNIPLNVPNTDILYKGATRYGQAGIINSISLADRFSCCVAKNKLWCIVPVYGTLAAPNFRLEVYDFVRKYWRMMSFSTYTVPSIVHDEPNGFVTGFFNLPGPLRYLQAIDLPPDLAGVANGKSFNGTLQGFDVRFPFIHNGTPNNRKDALTLTLQINTGGSNVTVSIYVNSNASTLFFSRVINTSTLSWVQIDASSVINKKNFQIRLQDVAGVNDFELKYISLDYEPHPPEIKVYTLRNINYGPNKKRLRTWPFVLDTQGNDVSFTPIVDGQLRDTQILNTNFKLTQYYYALSDFYGADYAGILVCSSGVFELYEVGQPEIVQTLPLPKKFDQLGPIELFRYGKINRFEFRLIAFNQAITNSPTNDIPVTIYEEDQILSGASQIITVNDSQEKVYEVRLPKGIYGSVLRCELGPVTFPFHRIYTRVLAAISGVDTDMRWFTMESTNDAAGQ